MAGDAERELLDLTRALLEAITRGDWDAYAACCDESLSAFEPEARGQRVDGLAFHRFYFERVPADPTAHVTLASPHVRMLGDDAAIVSYVRLVQRVVDGAPHTAAFEETRVWRRTRGAWKHVHFHRSIGG